MTWTIKGNDGTVKATVHALEYNGEWMGERYVTVTVESPYPIEFAIGDYLEYRGERFEINYDPGKIKSAPSYIKGDAFKYENIKFNSLADELTRCEFRDVVPSDNQIHYTSLPKFTFYGGVRDLAGRIQANLDRTYPGKWTVTVSDEYAGDKELNVSVDNQNVWDALSILVNDFETYFTINGRTITIGAAGIPAGHLFKYGKGNGLYEIEQNAEADQAIVTRLRAYGSERNLPHRYYHNLPNIDRAHADIHAVIGKTQLNNGAVDCVATFVFLSSYIDTQKCFKYTNADNETFYWLTVTLNGKSYAASVDTSKSPQQIVLGYRPPKGYSGSSNWVLHKPDMDAITSGTSVAFDCYKPTAPGIVEGQHVPNNMAVNFLMLPGFPETTFDPYIDSPNIGALGIREGTVFFDGSQEGLEEIYPSIEGMTAEQLIAAGVPCNSTGALDMIVSAEQMTDNGIGEVNESGNSEEITPATFKVTLKDLGFNLWAYRVAGEAPVLSFKTGMLGGRDFEIVGCVEIKDSYDKVTGYEVELNRVYDDDIKLWFPYSASNAKPGDKFVLLHIEMPEVYIKAASQRLLEAATAWLAKNDYSRSVYAPKVDEIFMARQHDEAMASGGSIKSLHDTLTEGMLLLFEDSDLNIDASIFIDRLTIKESNGPIPTYEVTLKEEKTVGRLDRMQNQIDSLASGRGQGSGYTAAQIRSMIDAYGGERFLSKIKADRTPYKLSSDQGFEVGNYQAGVSGGMFGIDKTDNQSFADVFKLWVHGKAYFETLTIIEAATLAGKKYITPGGAIKCTKVEEVKNDAGNVTAYRCYFLSEQGGEKTETKIIAGDQAISEMFNAKTGTTNKVSNHRYWRYVNAVNNDAYTDDAGNHYGYIDLSATDCEANSDIPKEGDVIDQFGNRTDAIRQAAMVFSTVDPDAPSIKLLTGIGSGETNAEHYLLDGKDIISQGYDHVKGCAYFKCYGDTYIGAPDKSTFINLDTETNQLDVKANIHIGSTYNNQTFEQWLESYGYTDDTEVEKLAYLKEALQQDIKVSGGLMLATLVSCGYKDSAGLRHTLAGMNGGWVDSLAGRTIASWWGGEMIDRFGANGALLNPVPDNAATALVRMDGSAYWASGNIQFRANGSAQFGLDDSAITIGADGHLTIGNGISINIGGNAQVLGESIASVTELANKLSHLFTPYLGNSAKSWASIKTLSDYDSIKVNKSIWTDGFVSARGLNANGGSGGGSGSGKSYLSDLLDVDLGTLSSGQVLTWNGTKWVNSALTLPDMAGYALESWVEANYYTKAEVNTKNYIKVIDCFKTTEWNEIRSTSDSMTMRAFDVYGKEAGGPYVTGNVLEIVGRYNHWQPQLWFDSEKGGSLRHRNKTYNDSTWGEWHKLLDSHNYASVLDTAYVKKTGDTMTGLLTIRAAANGLINLNTTNAFEIGMRFIMSDTSKGWIGYHHTYGTNLYNYQCNRYLAINDSGVPNLSGSTIWHAGNDGAGSGLDADLLDGYHATSFARLSSSNATVGASNLPVYLNAGTVTAVSSVGEAFLSWGGGNYAGSFGPVDAAIAPRLGANRLAFANPNGTTFQYSTNGGSSWTDYGLTATEKRAFFDAGAGWALAAGKAANGAMTTNHQLRVIINTGSANIYTELKKFIIYVSTNGVSGLTVTIERALQNTPTSFVTAASNVPLSGWSGFNVINVDAFVTYGNNPSQQYGVIRFTFKCTGAGTNKNPFYIFSIMGFGGIGWTAPSQLALNGHLYSYDGDQNATFPAKVTAASFAGSLSGNASSATKLQTARSIWGQSFDGSGNVSGNISNVANIIADYYYLANSSTNPYLRLTLNSKYWYVQAYNDILFVGAEKAKSMQIDSNGNVGIGLAHTTAPTAKLDVAGLVKASSGIQIATTADIGWYSQNSRICAGNIKARGVNVGSLLVSDAWADATKVPTNGIYSKGEIISSNSNAFRAAFGNYGAMLRMDSTNFYVLLTDSGSPYGTFNNLRPLYINLATGLVKMQQGLQIGECTISWDAANNMLKFDKGLYSEGPVSARGVNANGGSGGGSGNYLQINGDNATDATLPHLFQKLYEYDSALIDGDFMFVSDEQSQLEYGWRITMLQLWNYIKSKMGLAFTVDGDNVAIGCQPGKLTLNGVTINAGSAVTCNSLTAQSVTANGVTIGGPSADCVKIKYQGKTYTLQLAKLIQAGYLT